MLSELYTLNDVFALIQRLLYEMRTYTLKYKRTLEVLQAVESTTVKSFARILPLPNSLWYNPIASYAAFKFCRIFTLAYESLNR